MPIGGDGRGAGGNRRSVPESYAELPIRTLAAVDFTSYSLDAARNATALMVAGSDLHLVHVTSEQSSGDFVGWRETEWIRAIRQDAEGCMEAAVEEISQFAPAISVHAHFVDGRPVQAILRLAEALEVEMIAAGTNGYGLLGRPLMGSVATQLLRRSRCVTLIAPPRRTVPAMDYSIPNIFKTAQSLGREALAEAAVRAS